jgi:hypothetical protein
VIKNAAELLKAGALRTEVVTVRDVQVKVRELSVAQRKRFAEASKVDPMGSSPLLVAMCALDEAGNPLFTESQVGELAELSPELVDSLAKAVIKVSGLDSKDEPGNA